MKVEERDISSYVTEETVSKAVTALVKWHSQQQRKQSELLDDDDQMIHVVIGLKGTLNTVRTNGYRIPIPHSLYPLDGGKEVCLIVKDDSSEEGKRLKEAVKKDSSCGITKVLSVSKLRTKYKAFEARRQLLGSFDLFLTDDRIVTRLPQVLGAKFFKKKKHPIPVKLTGKSWKEGIRAACDATYLYVSGGPCMVVRTARFSQSEREVCDNVMAVVAGAVEKVPKKWKSISSLHIKTTDSLPLPIYVASESQPTKISLAKK